uniref:Uncharacterized protein n=1 Tax=Arundo donax TaxID=35708 RepID=A0A0A9GE53_ARUDO
MEMCTTVGLYAAPCSLHLVFCGYSIMSPYHRISGCKWGGLWLPAPRPHQPRAVTWAHAADHTSLQAFCGASRQSAIPHAATSLNACLLAVGACIRKLVGCVLNLLDAHCKALSCTNIHNLKRIGSPKYFTNHKKRKKNKKDTNIQKSLLSL